MLGTACVKSGGSKACSPPPPATSSNIVRNIAPAEAQAALFANGAEISPKQCTDVGKYSCSVRIFSPNIANGRLMKEECAGVSELGGSVCLEVDTLTFNTLQAARSPSAVSDSIEPGGDHNRSEYRCVHSDLRVGETFLAVGEDDNLARALRSTFDECYDLTSMTPGTQNY